MDSLSFNCFRFSILSTLFTCFGRNLKYNLKLSEVIRAHITLYCALDFFSYRPGIMAFTFAMKPPKILVRKVTCVNFPKNFGITYPFVFQYNIFKPDLIRFFSILS